MILDSNVLPSVADTQGKYALYFVNVFSPRVKHLVNICLQTPVGLVYMQSTMNTCQDRAT